MFEVQISGKSMIAQFAAMHNPVGSAAKAIIGAWNAIGVAFKTNPIGAIITVIVSAFYALRNIITQNQEAFNTLNRILAPFKQLLDVIIDVLMTCVNWLLKWIETILNGLMKLAEKLPFIGGWFKELNEESEKAIQLERDKQALQEKQRENIQKIAEKERQIAKLRDDAAQRYKYNAQERIKLLEEAKDLELEILELKREELETEISILNRATDKVKATTEWKDQIAEANAALIRLDTEFFTKSRALDRQLSAARIEDQREAAEAAKKALDDRLKNEENALNQQIPQCIENNVQHYRYLKISEQF